MEWFWISINKLCSHTDNLVWNAIGASPGSMWSEALWMQREQKGHGHINWNESTYPNVLINPQVVPSAYREHMSPIWRKLDILSDMIGPGRLHLWRIETKIIQSHHGSNAIALNIDKLDVNNSHLVIKASITWR